MVWHKQHMTERVLVTGASGFVGKVVCRKLIESGYTPRAGLRDVKLWPALRAATPSLSEFAVLGDLGGNPNLHAAFADVSAVVHLAARVHVMRDDASDPLEEYRRINVEGTSAVALAAIEQGVRRMIFVSTVKVNGESTTRTPFAEGDLPAPQNPYAVSKWEAEVVLRSIAAKTGLEVVILRPPLVYGPGVGANFLALNETGVSRHPYAFARYKQQAQFSWSRESRRLSGTLCHAPRSRQPYLHGQ